MDFKSMVENDMAVFHNTEEMAEMLNMYYDGICYTVPAIMDNTEAVDRANAGDHAEGIYQIDRVAYIPLESIGFVPRKGAFVEIGTEETGYEGYEIRKSDCEDGEIILEMVVYAE